jgi:hypothetical protein
MWVLAVASVAAVGAAGCDGADDGDVSREGHVLTAAVRDVLTEQPPPTDPDELPVVFVVGVGEEDIAADVQAEVTRELDDDAVVRFADEREEAVEEDEPHVPVRDAGVLLVVGEVAVEGDPVELSVEVYRSDQDWSDRVLTIASGPSQWTVTSSSVVPADGA